MDTQGGSVSKRQLWNMPPHVVQIGGHGGKESLPARKAGPGGQRDGSVGPLARGTHTSTTLVLPGSGSSLRIRSGHSDYRCCPRQAFSCKSPRNPSQEPAGGALIAKRGRWSSGNLLEVKLMRRPGPNGGDCATQPGGRVEAGERALLSPWFET